MKSIRFVTILRMCALGLFIISFTGCAHTNRPWGAETTIWPGWQTYGEAAKDAIADPHTWIPLIGAGIFATGNLDKKTTEWAVKKDLMFDNSRTANRYSDDWLDASELLVYVTAIAAPSGDDASEWLINKSKGLTATAIISKSAYTISSTAKQPFNRDRPDGSNSNSFPSSHALRSSMWATMSARNIESMPLTGPAKLMLQGGAYSIAGMTAWARMEANSHYPSDVLVGYSLGHFFGAFLNDAFITPMTDNKVQLDFGASANSWQLGFKRQFD